LAGTYSGAGDDRRIKKDSVRIQLPSARKVLLEIRAEIRDVTGMYPLKTDTLSRHTQTPISPCFHHAFGA
jgi:hypothetical protein